MCYIAYFCLMQALKCIIHSAKAQFCVILCSIVLYLAVHITLYCMLSKDIA